MNLPDLMSRWTAQSPALLMAKANEHVPLWLSLLLVVMIGYYLAKIAWLLYPRGG